MNIYVANIPYVVSEDQLRELFEQHGSVDSVKIVLDRETQRSRGFGFVEMGDESGKAAIENLDGQPFHGRELKVNEARPRPERD